MSLYDVLGGNKNNLTTTNGIKYPINGKIHLYIISILKHIWLFFSLFLVITDKRYKIPDKRYKMPYKRLAWFMIFAFSRHFSMVSDKRYKIPDKRFALFWCVDALFWCVFYVPRGTARFFCDTKKKKYIIPIDTP